jgi:hypothetical protein
LPATLAVQETVAVPELVMLLGEIEPQMSPLGTVSDRKTTPVNPPRAVIVIVEVADWPTLVGVGEDTRTEKSGIDETETAIVVECESEPLLPVTVTV